MPNTENNSQLLGRLREDMPGFISDQFYALDPKKYYIRSIFIPESFFVNLERNVIAAEGNVGKARLYSIGKRYGYRLASFNKFPKGNVNKVTLTAIYQFFEIAYAKKMSTLFLDLGNKSIQMSGEDFIIISSGSNGFLDPVGCWAGIWAYLNNDYSLEACLAKVGSNRCDIVSGSIEFLQSKGLEPIKCDLLPRKIDFALYMKNNKAQATSTKSTATFKKLFDNEYVYYRPGKVILNGSKERMIPSEASKLYEIEQSISSEIVFNSAYAPFYEIGSLAEEKTPADDFLCDLLSGLGFGIVNISSSENHVNVTINGYPWFEVGAEMTNFAYINGAVCGFLSGSSAKSYKSENISVRHANNAFIISMNITQS